MTLVVEDITPQLDGGRFAVKRICGDSVAVGAAVFADGHDTVRCALLYRPEQASDWHRAPMTPLVNDRWQGSFTVQLLGRYLYTVEAWVDAIETWQRNLAKRHAAGQDLEVEFARGVLLTRALAERAPPAEALRLREWASAMADASGDHGERLAYAQCAGLRELSARFPDPELTLRYDPPLPLEVDRDKARFSSWYEMFPRSAAVEPGVHGSFADCEARLPYVAAMGFDVLYLPPVHPIGVTARKGPNNQAQVTATDPGSPWAIGGEAGGHKSIHPELGTLEDFRRLVAKAAELDIEVALDIAFQTSPDHPYVHQHPEWFLKRPDGTIQYAENPPKAYQDIYPLYFDGPTRLALWNELKSVVEFWIAQGVRIFRVDNPHTKPFAMWEWLIREVRRLRPDVLFLAEAFTRPAVMYRLAKLGFTQSYSYFAWRNTKHELTQYFTELAAPPVCDFLRPNLWPNTPDILTEYLQFGGRGAFMVRVVLAATLGASYGIYGPAYELMEHEPRDPGSEEYLDSEKYQLRHWDIERSDSLRDFIARLNRIRREQPSLQRDRGLKFHAIDNEAMIAYSKSTEDCTDSVLIVANLDPHQRQTGWLELDLAALGLPPQGSYQVHDLLSGSRFLWQGPRSFVALDPASAPAHVFRIRRRVRSERDFDYFA